MRMVGAQQPRTVGMRIFAVALRKDAERGKQPQHAVEGIGIDPRRFGESLRTFRGFPQRIGNTQIGNRLKATCGDVRVGDLHNGRDRIGLHGSLHRLMQTLTRRMTQRV